MKKRTMLMGVATLVLAITAVGFTAVEGRAGLAVLL